MTDDVEMTDAEAEVDEAEVEGLIAGKSHIALFRRCQTN